MSEIINQSQATMNEFLQAPSHFINDRLPDLVTRREFEGLKKEVERLNKLLTGMAKILAGRND